MAHIYNSQLVRERKLLDPSWAETTDFDMQDAFDLYHQVHDSPQARSARGGPALPALGHAIAGSTGAAISNLITYPLSLIITRLQIQSQLRSRQPPLQPDEYTSIRDAAAKVYSREGGLGGFYTGVVPDTSKTIADSFLFFLAYNFLRQSRLRARKASSSHLPVVDELSVGFLAGAFSKLLTTPIANIVTRKQASSMMSGRKSGQKTSSASVRSIAVQIRSERGLQGFWSGYSASLFLTLNPSLTFFFFETLKRLLLPRSHRSNPSPQATFLLAASSKALASAITYPFSLAKSRIQASVGSPDDEAAKATSSTAGSTVSDVRAKASSNVFDTISEILRIEGAGALYEGLGGEILKGFFSHGITIIMKDTVHMFIIQLYYTVLSLLKRYASPDELTRKAKEHSSQLADEVRERAGVATANAKEGVQTIVAKGGDVGEVAGTKMKPVRGVAQDVNEWTSTVAVTVKDTLQNVDHQCQDTAKQGLRHVGDQQNERLLNLIYVDRDLSEIPE